METSDFTDVTEPLKNGDELPTHPALTTAREIVEYGRVWDDSNGVTLHGGLHQNEIKLLMCGQKMGLSHLYRYAIRDKKIYHTRNLVCIDVKTKEADVV